MTTSDNKKTQILLDFIVNLATYLVIINFGYMVLAWVVEIVVSLGDYWTGGQWAIVADGVATVTPKLQMIVGICSIFIGLLLTYNKLRVGLIALHLPETTITSQDVPNVNGFDPATKRRLENVLTILIRVLAVAVIVTCLLDIARSAITSSEEVLTTGSLPIIIIGIPTIIGLFVLRIIIRQK